MEAIARIALFNNLFYVCAGTAVISLFLAVFFFIQFDIPSVYAAMTGKSRKRSIQRMQAQSRAGKSMHSRVLRRPVTGTLEGKTGQGAPAPQSQKQERPPAPPRPEPEIRPETGVLKMETPETQVLQPEPIRQEDQTPTEEELAPTEFLGKRVTFQITENTICVHTDEWI